MFSSMNSRITAPAGSMYDARGSDRILSSVFDNNQAAAKIETAQIAYV